MEFMIFKLQDVQGKYVSLSDYSNAQGFIIIFTCNHCPFAKLYPSRLNELNNKYGPKGFPLLAISSTDTITYEEDSYEKMIEKAEEGKYNFPYLFDGTQEVAKDFEAQKTPHAYVLLKGKGGWEIKYNGAIDDNGAEPNYVKERFVADAVDALLSGKEPKTKETK